MSHTSEDKISEIWTLLPSPERLDLLVSYLEDCPYSKLDGLIDAGIPVEECLDALISILENWTDV